MNELINKSFFAEIKSYLLSHNSWDYGVRPGADGDYILGRRTSICETLGVRGNLYFVKTDISD